MIRTITTVDLNTTSRITILCYFYTILHIFIMPNGNKQIQNYKKLLKKKINKPANIVIKG